MMKSVEKVLKSLALVHIPDRYGLPDGDFFNSDLGSDRDMGLRATAKKTHSTLVTNFPIRAFEVIMVPHLYAAKDLVDKENIEAAEARVSSGQ
jgi:hypothetical protein